MKHPESEKSSMSPEELSEKDQTSHSSGTLPGDRTKLEEAPAEFWQAIRTVIGLQRCSPPLQPVSRNGNLPLSFPQKRLWFLDQLEPGSCSYNIPYAFRVTGPLNVPALESSISEIVRRHEALRTSFPAVDGQPAQVISLDQTLTLPVVDLREFPETKREAEAQRLAIEEAQRPFDLMQGTLMRAALQRLNQEEYILLLTVHHIAFDGWSGGVFMRELAALYEAFSTGKPSPLPELPIQYADFAVWQLGWLQGEVLESGLSYWKQQLGGSLPVLQLPTDRPRPAVQTYRGSRQSLVIPKPLTEALKALSHQEGVTVFMTLLAVFQTLLYRYTGQEDIIVGSFIANRNRTDLSELIGFFVNTLVMRTYLGGNPSFQELLSRVRKIALGAYAHQDLPFEKLVEELQPERDLSLKPLFQVAFVLQNTLMPALELPGLTLSSLEILHSGTAKFDLTLELQETSEGLSGHFEYNTDLFDACTLRRMANHFQTLLEGVVANPQQRLWDLPLLTEAERLTLLVEWNDTQIDYPKDLCIHQLFEAQVERMPDAVAVVFEDQQLTYQELNVRANRIAHHLQSLGVEPEVKVGICMERSLEMVVGLLGILKSGGAYVPLDPAYPQERLALMLEDTQAPVLLTQQQLVAKLPQQVIKVVCLDADWETIAKSRQENPVSGVRANNLAYVMYTSGSTGRPKGVSVIHRGVVRLVKGTTYANLSADEVFLQLAPISFDASTFEIWGCLLNGARLVVMPPHTPSLQELGHALRRYQVTTLWLTAGLFHMMVDLQLEDLKNVRQFLVGGDVLSVPHVKKLLQELTGCRLINGYGPTESTTFTCCYPITESSKVGTSVSIGRPIANTRCLLLDSHLQPVPVGVPGELYIGGDGLARGYLNRPDLTAERFIPNPFSDEPGDRLYKTGDLVRYLSDGNIEFLGRIDQQVKIRGFRIELGEIEAVLVQHSSVRTAVVIAREDIPGEKRLIAYLVAKEQLAPPISELRSFLYEKLPDYMVPSAFLLLPALPLTPNGKVNRRALRAPDTARPEMERAFVAPQDTLELELTKIWEKVLGIEPIGVKDNFFELGGHSLLAVRLFAQIEKIFGKKLPLANLFQAPTVEQLASILHQEGCDAPIESLVQLQPGGDKPPLFCIYGILLYYDLALNLGSEQPVYGVYIQDEVDLLKAGRLETQQTALTSVAALASLYLREIRTLQPVGPYFLAGESFGGLVAFEMAQQLHLQGEKVALVALFDTIAPGGLKKMPWSERVSLHLRNLLREGATYALKKVKRRIDFSKDRLVSIISKVYKKFEHFGRPLPSYIQEVATRNVRQQLIEQAIRNYVPHPYPGKVILFRAMERSEFEGYYTDPQSGWGELVVGGLEVHPVPGDHIGILQEPEVRVLAEKLRVCLDEAQADVLGVNRSLLAPDGGSAGKVGPLEQNGI